MIVVTSSATASIIFSRYSSASSPQFVGYGDRLPRRAELVGPELASIRHQVDHAAEASSRPMGSWSGTGRAPRRSTII